MTLRLLYFAAVRELMKSDGEIVSVEGVRSIGELSAWLEQKEPLRGRLASVRFARNERMAGSDELLADGDVIALLPPVSGG